MTELDEKRREEVKQECIATAKEQFKQLRKMIRSIEKDLQDPDESICMGATLSAKVFHGFITQDTGYKRWFEECHRQIMKVGENAKKSLIIH